MKRLLILLVSLVAGQDLTASKCRVQKITQTDIPYTIVESGRYIVCEDLVYDGVKPGIAAITIAAHNVQLLFNNSSLLVTDSTKEGIHIGDIAGDPISEIVIAHDSISHSVSAGIGIHAVNAQKVILKNVLVTQCNVGLLVEKGCSDVTIDTCSFKDTAVNGVHLAQSSSVTFENSLFQNTSGIGLLITDFCTDCKIFTCSFPNAKEQNLRVDRIDGLLVKNSTFSKNVPFDATDTTDMVSLGFSTLTANTIRFQGCTFIGSGVIPNMMNFTSGAGLILDSCLFDMGNLTFGIALLNLGLTTQNSYVQGCTFNGNGAILDSGIFAVGDHVVIQNSLIQGIKAGNASGIHSLGKGCTVRSCTLAQNYNGLLSSTGSSTKIVDSAITQNANSGIILLSNSNVVAKNTITQNTLNGVEIQGASNAVLENTISGNSTGISALSTSSNNLIQNNIVHSNGFIGISSPLTNKVFNNTAYNNGVGGAQNYTAGIAPVVGQGKCTLVGANIDGALSGSCP